MLLERSTQPAAARAAPADERVERRQIQHFPVVGLGERAADEALRSLGCQIDQRLGSRGSWQAPMRDPLAAPPLVHDQPRLWLRRCGVLTWIRRGRSSSNPSHHAAVA